MKFKKIHNKGQAQLFKNPYLELLTKSHPLVIWGMYLPIMYALARYGMNHYQFPIEKVILLFFAGTFCWTFFEYVMHRWIFHFASEGKIAKKILYVMHGNHHEFPRDKSRLFMPPVPNLVIAVVMFSSQYLLLGQYAFVFFPGFVFGYLLYGSMHYAIHAWNPPLKWMKPLWRNHHLHHYKNDDRGFGVSTTLWDHVFGTMFEPATEKEEISAKPD